MDFSEVKTDMEVMKKIIYGNGVKGLVTRVEDITDKLDELENYMNEKLEQEIAKVLDKIEEKRRFNLGTFFQSAGLVVAIVLVIVDIMS